MAIVSGVYSTKVAVFLFLLLSWALSIFSFPSGHVSVCFVRRIA